MVTRVAKGLLTGLHPEVSEEVRVSLDRIPVSDEEYLSSSLLVA